jgi:hypothetical protein
MTEHARPYTPEVSTTTSLARAIRPFAQTDGDHKTAIPALTLHRRNADRDPESTYIAEQRISEPVEEHEHFRLDPRRVGDRRRGNRDKRRELDCRFGGSGHSPNPGRRLASGKGLGADLTLAANIDWHPSRESRSKDVVNKAGPRDYTSRGLSLGDG